MSQAGFSPRSLSRGVPTLVAVWMIVVAMASPVAAQESPVTDSGSDASSLNAEGTLLPEASFQTGEDPVVEVTGHGWGHGRGLSQYGA